MDKLSQINQEGIIGRGVLCLIVITGIVFSGITSFMLDDGLQSVFSENEVKPVPTEICENGLCFIEDSKGVSNKNLVQQRADISSTNQVFHNEDFSNLQLTKSSPVKELEKSGNKVTLFAEKDSFIREGIQNTNEGSNEALRVLGTGPINNRVLISFNIDDIQEFSSHKTLESATLKLYVEKNNLQWNDGQYISVHSLQTLWDEGNGVNAPVSNLIRSDGVTWSCPLDSNSCNENWDGGIFDQNPTDSVWISNQVDDYWIKFDVTLDILDYQESKENFGWIIMKDNEDSEGQINFASREAKSNNPELVLVFSDE